MGMARKAIVGIFVVLMAMVQTGCSNPQKEAARASTEASEAEKDVSENKSDEEACAGYKKALDSL
jgi:hypothetical protein